MEDKITTYNAPEESLEILKHDLHIVEEKISKIDITKAAFNPEIQKLIEQYAYLNEQIKQAEDILNAREQ